MPDRPSLLLSVKEMLQARGLSLSSEAQQAGWISSDAVSENVSTGKNRVRRAAGDDDQDDRDGEPRGSEETSRRPYPR